MSTFIYFHYTVFIGICDYPNYHPRHALDTFSEIVALFVIPGIKAREEKTLSTQPIEFFKRYKKMLPKSGPYILNP